MTFPRQRHDGIPSRTHSLRTRIQSLRTKTFQTKPFSIKPLSSSFCHLRPHFSHSTLLARGVFSSSAALAVLTAGVVPVHAKPFKSKFKSSQRVKSKQSPVRKVVDEPTTGAWAWATGTQTYLRVRPGAQTPAVAKVPRGTKMFVWGKFNGWYRVETPDHKFGWVYHDWLNCPKSARIAQLSHRKAVAASNRASSQTMYGTPEQLKAYYARHKASGAARGLAKQGVRLVAAPRATKIAKTTPKTAAKAHVSLATKPVQKPTRVAVNLPRVITPQTRPTATKVEANETTKVATTRFFERAQSGHSTAQHSSLPGFSSVSERPRFETERDETSRVAQAPRSMFQRGFSSAKSETIQPETTPEETSETVAPIATEAVASAVSAQQSSNAATIAVAKPAAKPVVRKVVAPRAKVAAKPAVKTAVAPRKASVKAVQVAKVPAAKTVKPAAKAPVKVAKAKPTRSQLRAQVRLARQKQREMRLASRRGNIRERMGMPRMVVPPMTVKGVKPISPEELMRARESFLSARRKTQPASSNAASLITPNGVLGGQANREGISAFPGGVQGSVATSSDFEREINSRDLPASFEPSSWSAPGSDAFAFPTLSSRGQMARVYYQASAKKVEKAAASKKPVVANRGGSPRDYYYRANPNAFGEGMANQALSYRGMPYIRGAASPSRGFDCSGLIYYLLRQRGYNPPRTAAGLASFGKSVSRDKLQTGDIVLFANTYKRGVSHVGVYTGNGNFVHAARSGVPLKVDSLNSKYYAKKYYGARRP